MKMNKILFNSLSDYNIKIQNFLILKLVIAL